MWKRNAGFKCNTRFIAKVSTDTLGAESAGSQAPGLLFPPGGTPGPPPTSLGSA